MATSDAPQSDYSVPILIVDDARFTLEMLRRVLRGTGFTDIRAASSAQQALTMQRERPADILVADWLMPGMDGLMLTRQIRQLDEDSNHYTYIILLTAREGTASLTQAFDNGVDDFISKAPDNQELLARLYAAGRIARLQNDLLATGRELGALRRELAGKSVFDAETGIGSRDYVEDQLNRLLRHVQERDGSAGVALTRLNERDAIEARYGPETAEEVVTIMGRRLVHSVRPLDRVGMVDQQTFAVLMHHERKDDCHPNTFRRVHRALNVRAYETQSGYLNASAAITLCGIDHAAAQQRPEPQSIVAALAEELPTARDADRVISVPWPPRR